LTLYSGMGFSIISMRTGEVAGDAGVNIQTLRYYERRGILPTPPRLESGYRDYGPETVPKLRFIKRAQELGFTLDEVETFLGLAEGGPEACEAAQELAHQRIAELDRRIGDLQAMRDALDRLAASCGRPRLERDCPLLRFLDEGEHLPSTSGP
jgi:DNA-binding transcriptional MerR regulator